MPSSRDQQRLQVGAEAKLLPEPTTEAEARRVITKLNEAVLAMSLVGDLGSAQDNQQAWGDLCDLEHRLAALSSKWGIEVQG